MSSLLSAFGHLVEGVVDLFGDGGSDGVVRDMVRQVFSLVIGVKSKLASNMILVSEGGVRGYEYGTSLFNRMWLHL